jgi:hypothetical protein
LDGGSTDLEGGLGPALVSVSASSDNPGVVAVEPAEQELRGLDSGIGSSGAQFRLLADEPGDTTVRFTATVTDRGKSYTLPELPLKVHVADCKYHVRMTVHWNYSDVIFSSGILDMDLLPDESRNVYKGSGPFSFLSGVHTGVPGCVVNLSQVNIDSAITGRIIDDSLKLSFTFGKGTENISVHCEGASASGSDGFDPRLSGLDPRDLPASGGTISQLLETSPPARLRITVERIVQ